MKILDKKPQMLKRHDKSQKSVSMKNGKNSVRRDPYANVPKAYKDVASGMETQFINHMIKQMRKSVHRVSPESSAEKFYNSMLDQERAKTMSETQGVGIKEIILDQIYPQKRKSFLNKGKNISMNKPVQENHNE